MSVRQWYAVRYLLRDLASLTATRIRQRAGTPRALLLGAVAAVLTVAVLVIAQTGGWSGTIRDISLNVAASALVAGGTVTGLLADTRRRAIARLLAHQQREFVPDGSDQRNWPNQTRAIAARLSERRRPGSLLVEVPVGRDRRRFVMELGRMLVECSVVTFVVPGHAINRSGPLQASLDRFQHLLAFAGVAPTPVGRTLRSLSARRRAVVILDGLDETDRPVDPVGARSLVRSRVEELSGAQMSFVAVIEAGSTPPELHHARLTLPRTASNGSPSLAADAASTVAGPPRRRAPATSRSPADIARERVQGLRQLGFALTERAEPSGRIGDVLRRVGAVATATGAVGHLLRPLRDLGGGHTDPTRPARQRLADFRLLHRAAQELLWHNTKQVDWGKLLAAVPEPEIPETLAAAMALEHAGVLERHPGSGRTMLGFADADLRELLVGMCVANIGLPLGYSLARSATAFTGEVVQRLSSTRRPGPTWAAMLAVAAADGALVAIHDASQALGGRARGTDLQPDSRWLAAAWSAASDPERIRYVRRLTAPIPEHVITLLWSYLEPPAFARTSHIVRRAIARGLGADGSGCWRVLHQRWTRLAWAAARGGLAWHQRRDDGWLRYGSALASMCWILPSVTVTAGPDRHRAAQLLQQLTAAVVPGSGPERGDAPDLGIEISLAEGCKDLCGRAVISNRDLPPVVTQVIAALLARSRSWVSRLLALQAGALTAAGDASYRDRCVEMCDSRTRQPGEHPIVRAYAGILREAVVAHPTDFDAQVRTVVWADDTEALETAGGELSDRAAYVLATTTIILNLAEARIRSGGDWRAEQLTRVTALTGPSMPGCVDRLLPALAFGNARCSCPLRLCGPDLAPWTRAQMPQVFAYRCLSEARLSGEHEVSKGILRQRAIRAHLRRLARVVPVEL